MKIEYTMDDTGVGRIFINEIIIDKLKSVEIHAETNTSELKYPDIKIVRATDFFMVNDNEVHWIEDIITVKDGKISFVRSMPNLPFDCCIRQLPNSNHRSTESIIKKIK